MAGSCNHCRKGFGACRLTCSKRCPDTIPIQKNRAEAREIMRKLGYGPDKRLALKVSTRNIPPFSRSGGYPDRSAEGNVHRRRGRNCRDRALVPQDVSQGLHAWWVKPVPHGHFAMGHPFLDQEPKSLQTHRWRGLDSNLYGAFPVKWFFSVYHQFFVRSGKRVLRPVACDQVPGARGRGQGTETLA